MKIRLAASFAALSLGLASVAHANILVNGGLESPVPPKEPDNLIYMTLTKNIGALPGWTLVSGEIDVVPNTYFQSAQGNDSVDMVGTPGIGEISQTFATMPGTQYELTFDFSVNPQKGRVNETNDIKRLQVSALAADGTTVLNSQIYQDLAGARTLTNMQYTVETFDFMATGPTSTLTLAALAPLNMPAGLTASTIYTGPVIDNLDLETGGGSAAPEPASLATLAIGGLLLMRRRKVA